MDLDRIKEGAAVLASVESDGLWFALWLQCEHYPGIWHLGVAFRDPRATTITRVDQLDTGLRVSTGVEAGARWWVTLPSGRATRARLRQVMQRLRRASAVRVPYGRLYSGGTIDAEGQYVRAPDETGLSCASVVLAVFEGVGWPLVDRATWAGRRLPPSTAEWVEVELTTSERERFANDHGLVVLAQEVAGACLFDLPRVPLADARRGAEHFEELARQRAHATAS